MRETLLARIYGDVQGVGMRYSIYKKASQLGLLGYVKNISDGSVEIEVQGPKEKIRQLLDYAENSVRWARVEKVDITWEKIDNKYDRFYIYG